MSSGTPVRRPFLWAIMPTGATKERVQLAQWALQHFRNMESPSLNMKAKLLILNEHPTENVVRDTTASDDVIEIPVNRHLPHLKTLGQVRNYGLSLIPSGDFIYIFDDDDYHHPTLFKEMYNVWQSAATRTTCMVQLKHRLNHNLLNGKTWASRDERGLVHFFGSIDRLRAIGFQYDSKNCLEDLCIHRLSSSEKCLFEQNNPSLYIRYTHDANTSIFVNPSQTTALLDKGPYQEYYIDDKVTMYCESVQPYAIKNATKH